MTLLKGMTWNHPRGVDPMRATAAEWEKRTGVQITWSARSLQDFETFPIAVLAQQYDLIVIDHPHVGQVAAEGALAPLEDVRDLAEHSLGLCYPSYRYGDQQWGYPIDAAAQAQAYREDLCKPAGDWAGVVTMARDGLVVLPLLPPHSLMCFFTLAAALGAPCATAKGPLVDRAAGIEAIGMLSELSGLIEPSNFAMDPIAACDAMARTDALVAVMPLGYGYVSYARDGFRPRRLRFCDIPLPDHQGSTLGGTGIAVSAFSPHRDEASAYARWVASVEVQRGLYASAGGQPGHAVAWGDDTVNAAAHNFYRDTRRTLERAWMRPRHNGYMAFQDSASRRLNAGLLAREPAGAILEDIDTLFRGSF